MKLVLFFTYGMSLEEWYKKGYLKREIDIYNEFSKYFKKIIFVTYGSNDKKYEKYLPKNFKVYHKKLKIPNLLYSFTIPFVYKFDNVILKTNQILGSWTAVLAKKRYKSLLVVRTGYTQSKFSKNQNFLKKIVVNIIEHFGFKNADHVIITTKFDKEYLINKYKLKKQKITVIQNSINTDLFKKINSKKERDIIAIGRYEEQKNFPALFEALKDLNLKTTIVGYGSQKNDLMNFAEKHNLDIKYLDKIENDKIPQLLAKHKIFVQPSLYEGNPKTLLEAMSCEIPCLATNVEGIKEIINNKEGILCKTDSQSIKKAIISLLNDKNRNQLAKNARKAIEKNNSFKINIEKEVKIYENLKNS